MHVADFVVIALLAAAVVLAARGLRRRKGTCGGDCARCDRRCAGGPK